VGLFALTVLLSNCVWSAQPPEPATAVPAAVEIASETLASGWTAWTLVPAEGAAPETEFVSALKADTDSTLWVGTSRGRVLTLKERTWTQQATLEGCQVTSVAPDGAGTVWLSASDGVARMDASADGHWTVTRFRTCYWGHPAFVSGGYVPGPNAERPFGYVRAIYVPPRERAYAPFAVAGGNGLYPWGGYGHVWHHFLPHYLGANTAWFDLRELFPHRWPTCILEDAPGNLWVGTDGDGIVRYNWEARSYHERRSSEDARGEGVKPDGTEFSRLGPDDVGVDFVRVGAIAAHPLDARVWIALSPAEGDDVLVEYDGGPWAVVPLPDGCLAEAAGTAPDPMRILDLAFVAPDLLVLTTTRGPALLSLAAGAGRTVPVRGDHVEAAPDGSVAIAGDRMCYTRPSLAWGEPAR
jgi:hypothetical protein